MAKSNTLLTKSRCTGIGKGNYENMMPKTDATVGNLIDLRRQIYHESGLRRARSPYLCIGIDQHIAVDQEGHASLVQVGN